MVHLLELNFKIMGVLNKMFKLLKEAFDLIKSMFVNLLNVIKTIIKETRRDLIVG